MTNKLVAYFSAEGTTAKVAKRLADTVNADLFEIKPQIPYTAADLKWMNPLARCNREKFGKKDVPIENTIDRFSDYDTVLIGFPIWYYGAPNIIQTFLKQYDFSGKKLALFATSGGSDIGKTEAKLTPFLNGKGKIVAAKLFQPDVTEDELLKWGNSVTE